MKCIINTVGICLFCFVYLNYSIPASKLLDYTNFNFTKRPLNLYITANGKHVLVNNRTLDTVQDGPSALKHKHGSGSGVAAANAANVLPQLEEIVDYRIAVPPFAIKNRGSVILLHNTTGNSLSWHQGYPSITQMLAASGHKTVSPELIHYRKESELTNTKLIHQIIHAEDLKNITLISIDQGSAKILLDVLKSFSASIILGKKNENTSENLNSLIDGVVLVNAGVDNLRQIKEWQTTRSTNSNKVIPFLFINTLNGNQNVKLVTETPEFKYLNINKNVSDLNSKADRFDLMQILTNFYDFIHPR